MARRGRALARRARVIVRAGGARAGRLARRAGGAALSAARDEKHTVAAVAVAAALGYARRSGTSLPHISALGIPATYGLAAFMLAKFTKNRMARHAATGLLSVAAYEWAARPAGAVSGEEIEF